MEPKSIKELKELLEGLKLLAVTAKKISADGKINVDDLSSIVELGMQMGTLAAAVEGIDQVPAELKDLDEAEVIELITIGYSIAAEISK